MRIQLGDQAAQPANSLENSLGHRNVDRILRSKKLREGLSVVLDFPANTVKWRSWMRSLIDQAHVAHELHFLDVSDAICKPGSCSATPAAITRIRSMSGHSICS
jgi:hypothetical protein